MEKTDLECFIDLYKRFNINLKPFENKFGTICIEFGRNKGFDKEDKAFNQFGGYDYYCLVNFTKEGKFISQSFYE